MKGTIAARLDALPAAERQLLLDASVVGRLLAAAGDDQGSQNALITAQETVNGFAASLSEGRRGAFLASPPAAILTG